MPDPLSIMDQCLAVAAIGTIALTSIRWGVQSGKDPLGGAPLRPNTFREDVIGLAIFVWLIAAAALSSLSRLAELTLDDAVRSMLVGNGAHVAGILACLAIVSVRFEGGLRAFFLGREGRKPVRWLPGTVMFIVVSLGACPLIRDATVSAILHLAPGFEFNPHPTIQALHEDGQPLSVIVGLWLGAVLVAPLAEELFFRGIVQTFLVGVFRSRWAAIAVTATIFGGIHYAQPHAVLALMLFGGIIGYAYERTGAFLPPLIIHIAFNLKTLIWEALGASTG